MAIKIIEGMQWPPVDAARYKMQEHAAWYSGQPECLADYYYDTKAKDFLNLNYEIASENRFWGRQIRNHSKYFIHVPIAGDISNIASAYLFGETPVIRFTSDSQEMSNMNKDLDEMLTKSGFYKRIVEGAEICSALGGVFFKIAWDQELDENPIPVVVQPEQAFPVFKFGRLQKVDFVYVVSNDGSTVFRLVETIEQGKVTNTLYQGSDGNLGQAVSLKACEETSDLEDTVDTGDMMLAFYVPNMLPNRLFRGENVGRSDYAGSESLMDALDETFSSWMTDVQIARGKLHVPTGYIKALESGKAAFNIDTSMYEEMDADPTNLQHEITATQFAIRSEEFEKTSLNLLDRIISSAGYSPQSFGLNIQGRAESGTALNVRERATFTTTAKKQGYWEDVLSKMVTAMCDVKNAFLGGSFTCDTKSINIAFSDAVFNNITEIANAVKLFSDAKAASTDTKIRMLHPEWEDTQVEEEIERINNDDASHNPLDNPDDMFQMESRKLGEEENKPTENTTEVPVEE